MNTISNAIIPLMVLLILFYGIRKKVSVYDTFILGARESFDMILSLFPTYLAMILGVNLFLNSNALNFFLTLFKPILSFTHFPAPVFPMAILRSVSGSTTLAMMSHFFEVYGPDSFIGRLASIIQGSSDTTLYVLTLYFGSVGVVKTKYALKVGLLSDFLGVLASLVIAWLFFGS